MFHFFLNGWVHSQQNAIWIFQGEILMFVSWGCLASVVNCFVRMEVLLGSSGFSVKSYRYVDSTVVCIVLRWGLVFIYRRHFLCSS